MTPEQRQKFRQACKNPDLVFYFVPSADLKQRVASEIDPNLVELAKWMKIAILTCESGQGIELHPDLVLKYVDGVDDPNVYWMRLGEIRVAGYGDMVLRSSTKSNNG